MKSPPPAEGRPLKCVRLGFENIERAPEITLHLAMGDPTGICRPSSPLGQARRGPTPEAQSLAWTFSIQQPPLSTRRPSSEKGAFSGPAGTGPHAVSPAPEMKSRMNAPLTFRKKEQVRRPVPGAQSRAGAAVALRTLVFVFLPLLRGQAGST